MRFFAVCLVFSFSCLLSPAQANSGTKSLEHGFAAGGKVNLRLESGAYTIQPSDTDHITVRWEQSGDVKVVLDVNGGTASLRTENTPHNGFNAQIEVPRKSDLWIRLTAGDLEVGPVRGNKDIESHAGNIEIAIVDAQDYSRVDASVYAGDLEASPFGVQKGGLFRSFDWRGSGRYRLHAHVMSGDINMHALVSNERKSLL